jgi:hypothetical protein
MCRLQKSYTITILRRRRWRSSRAAPEPVLESAHSPVAVKVRPLALLLVRRAVL